VTEEEAKTKRCCGPNGCGRLQDDLSGSPDNAPRYCIGSACMAWRHAPVSFTQVNDNGKTVQIEGRSYTDFYCGLAGKP